MNLNLGAMLLWGFCATVVLTTTMALAQGLGISRMSLPLILGALFSSSRQRANLYGFALQMAIGWLFSGIYALLFEGWHRATWWMGALIGLVQALFVLAVLLPLLPHFHPRMASEDHGPDPTRQLEPPGFMAVNYGRHTPGVTILAHLLYGAILGGFYTLAARG